MYRYIIMFIREQKNKKLITSNKQLLSTEPKISDFHKF